MKTNGKNFGIHQGTGANVFYDSILDAILEFSSDLYSSACTRGKPANLVTTPTFSRVRNTTEVFPTQKKIKQNNFGRHLSLCGEVIY